MASVCIARYGTTRAVPRPQAARIYPHSGLLIAIACRGDRAPLGRILRRLADRPVRGRLYGAEPVERLAAIVIPDRATVAIGGALPITWTRAANQSFDVRKILAIGVALVGMGLFGIRSKPNLEWIIGSYGLCAGYVGLGIVPLVISLPTAYFLFRDAAPDGVDKDGCFTRQANGLTMKALGQWRFWLLAIGLILISFSLSVSVPNLGKRSSSWMPCLRARSCR